MIVNTHFKEYWEFDKHKAAATQIKWRLRRYPVVAFQFWPVSQAIHYSYARPLFVVVWSLIPEFVWEQDSSSPGSIHM